MRIIAGTFKGRTLRAPEGRTTRPTSDRARETLFNVLEHASWAPGLTGRRVIDLFAGAGALGFEALSRGAAFCLFVETDEGARGAIRTSIDSFGLFGVTRLHRRSATDLGRRPASLGAPFDIAFVDPPYRQSLVGPCAAGLVAGDWLAKDALLIAETAADEALSLEPDFDLMDRRTIGAAELSVWRRVS